MRKGSVSAVALLGFGAIAGAAAYLAPKLSATMTAEVRPVWTQG
jgi:hypothetical protein